MFSFLLFTICTIVPSFVLALPLPLGINIQDLNTTDNLSFALNLPNNDTVTIGLSFQLLSYSPAGILKNNIEAVKQNNDSKSNVTIESTTTTITPKKNVLKRNIVTVEEAIENFRQDLIKKEIEISGIIQSKDIFYRHFKLEFDDDQALTIRCSYDSNFNLRSLSIKCFEYHQYETERVLSNGEVEVFMKEDIEYKSDVEYIDFKTMKQTYSMNID